MKQLITLVCYSRYFTSLIQYSYFIFPLKSINQSNIMKTTVPELERGFESPARLAKLVATIWPLDVVSNCICWLPPVAMDTGMLINCWVPLPENNKDYFVESFIFIHVYIIIIRTFYKISCLMLQRVACLLHGTSL